MFPYLPLVTMLHKKPVINIQWTPEHSAAFTLSASTSFLRGFGVCVVCLHGDMMQNLTASEYFLPRGCTLDTHFY